MSFAMDDLNRSYGVDPALQTRLIEEKRSADKPDETKTSDSVKKEPEVNDVFEPTQQKQDLVKKNYEDVQNEATALDIKGESLKKINSYVTDIKSTIESENSSEVSRQKINENYEKINQVAKEAVSKEEMKLSDIKNLEITTPEQKKESVEKLDDIINNIKSKEQEISDKKEKLAQSVNQNSLVELKFPSSTETEDEISTEIKKEEAVSAEKLKESAIKNITEAPHKNLKMHIKHIDSKLLLAMLSLRGA